MKKNYWSEREAKQHAAEWVAWYWLQGVLRSLENHGTAGKLSALPYSVGRCYIPDDCFKQCPSFYTSELIWRNEIIPAAVAHAKQMMKAQPDRYQAAIDHFAEPRI